jgi:hypothetical protein
MYCAGGLSLSYERSVSGEKFGVSSRSPSFNFDQGVKELAKPFGSRTRAGNERSERRHHLVDPTLNDQVSKLRLRLYMPVNGSVAHAKRAGHVDHRGLFRAESSHHILGCGYNTIPSERFENR